MLEELRSFFNRKNEERQSTSSISTTSVDYADLSKILSGTGSYDNISTVFSAKELISNSVASTPIFIYSTNEDNVTIDKDSLEQKAFNRPNDLHSMFDIIKSMVLDCIDEGNGYCIIKRDKIGNAIGFIPVKSNYVQIEPDDYILPTSANYVISGKNGATRTYDSSDVIHIYLHSEDNYRGISLLSYASRSLQLAESAELSAKKFYDKGGNINAVVGLKGRSSNGKTDNVKRNLGDALKNGGGILVVESDSVDVKSLSIDPKNSQMLETREYNSLDICRYFNLPASMVNANNITSPSNEEEWMSFMSKTLMPYYTILESEFNKKVFVTRDIGIKSVKFKEEYLLRADKKTQSEYWSKLIMHSMATPKQASIAIGIETVDDSQDMLFVNNNMIPLEALSDNEAVAKMADNKLSEKIKGQDGESI